MKNKTFADSFKCALGGILHTFINERNFKIHALAAFVTIAAAIKLEFNSIKFSILVITISLVLIIELLNTAIETIIDLVCKNKYNELARIAKDISAGAVLVASIAAVIIGYCLFFYT